MGNVKHTLLLCLGIRTISLVHRQVFRSNEGNLDKQRSEPLHLHRGGRVLDIDGLCRTCI